MTPESTPTATSTPPAVGSLVLQQTLPISPWALVHDLDWSPDGRWLAVAAGEAVYLYEAGSLALQQSLHVGSWASEVHFASQGAENPGWLALAARDGSIQVWDAVAGIRLAHFHGHNKGANSLAFSPDAQTLASSGNDGILRLWTVASILAGGEVTPAAEMIGGAFAVPVVRFNPQGDLLASVDMQVVRLRDPDTTLLVRTLRNEQSIFAITFSPDGAILAAAEAGESLVLWQVASDALVDRWQTETPGEGAFLWDVAFSPDGQQLAAVSSEGWAFVWAYPQGEALAAFPAHSRGASAVAFSPDGRLLATGGLDGLAQVWEAP